MLNQNVLNDFQLFLSNVRFKNKIEEIALEHCTDEQGDFINFNVLRIKKSQQNKGFGSMILSDVVELADHYNVRVKLLVTNLWGSEILRLQAFCSKQGFVINKTDTLYDQDKMIYYPKKIVVKHSIKNHKNKFKNN